MHNFSYVIAGDGSIVVFAEGRQYTVHQRHPNYRLIRNAIGEVKPGIIRRLCLIDTSIEEYLSETGEVFVRNGQICVGPDSDEPLVLDETLFDAFD